MKYLNSRVKMVIQRSAQMENEKESQFSASRLTKFFNLTENNIDFKSLMDTITDRKSISPSMIDKAAEMLNKA
jgi:hypothetical protein